MIVKKSDIIELIKSSGVIGNLETLDPASSLRENGLDSLDMANVALSMEEKYKIKIPDIDLAKLFSINSIVEYLSRTNNNS